MTLFLFFFFFNDTATTEIYTLSLHDALPILRAEVAPSGVHRADRYHQLVAGGALQHVAVDPGLQRPLDVLDVRMHRQDDDARGAAPGADHLRRFGAVHLRHRLVHDHHIGLALDAAAHRLEAVGGERDHLHVVLALDQPAQAVGDDTVIIRQQHLDRHSATLTVRRVPPPSGSASTLKAPPTA